MKGNRMKLIAGAAMVACIAFAVTLAGCQAQGGSSSSAASSAASSSGQSGSSTAQPIVGGWEVAADPVASQLTSEQQESFAKATEGYVGVGLEPVAVLGTQVVAGTNSAYLCQGTTVTQTPEAGWYVAVVYKDLNGNSSMTSVEKIDLADVKTADRFETGLAGGWQIVPNESNAVVLPEGALTAWQKAAEAYDGGALAPVAVLGTQVVAGTNYLMLATVTDASGVSTLHAVTLYADLQESGQITDDALFDLLAYVQ